MILGAVFLFWAFPVSGETGRSFASRFFYSIAFHKKELQQLLYPLRIEKLKTLILKQITQIKTLKILLEKLMFFRYIKTVVYYLTLLVMKVLALHY